MSIKVVNQALRRIYATPIVSLDGSTEIKRIIQDELGDALDYVLRKNIYLDAAAVVCPDEVAVADPCCDLPAGYAFAFTLPKDYVRAKRVDAVACPKGCDEPPRVQWRIANLAGCSVLVTDCKGIKLEYIARPASADLLPVDVRNVVRLRLAMALVDPLNADKSLKADIAAELKEAELIASGNSEEHDQTDEYLSDPGELLTARACMWGVRRG